MVLIITIQSTEKQKQINGICLSVLNTELKILNRYTSALNKGTISVKSKSTVGVMT